MLRKKLQILMLFLALGLVGGSWFGLELHSQELGGQATPLPANVETLPVTIITRVSFLPEFKNTATGTIYTVALGNTSAQQGPVQLVWARSGFAGIWTLRLKTPQGEGKSEYVIPQQGHIYETRLSYDPRVSLLMVAVQDLTDGTVVYQEVLSVDLDGGEISHAFALSQIAGAQVEGVEASPRFVPVGVKWTVVENGVAVITAPKVLDRSKEIGIRITPGVSVPLTGTFLIRMEDGQGRQLSLSEQLPVTGETLLPLQPEKLVTLQGPYQLQLVYGEAGELIEVFRQNVVVGKITVGDLKVEFVPETNSVQGAFLLAADGPVQNAQVSCLLQVTRQCLLTGDTQEEEMVIPCGTYDLDVSPRQVTFNVPVTSPGVELWQLTVEPQVAVQPAIHQEVNKFAQRVFVGVPKTEQEVSALSLARFKLRFVEEFVQQSVSDSHVERIMNQMTMDGVWKGSWPDIDYQDQRRGGAAKWEPTIHLERIRDMARAYSDMNSKFYKDETVYQRIMDGMNFWYVHRAALVNPGYFMNEITVPGLFLDILLLLGEEPPRHVLAFVVSRLDPVRDSNDVGANLPWRQLNHLKLAVLENDLEGIQRVYDRVNEEFRLAPELQKEQWRHQRWRSYVRLNLPYGPVEGIQVDYSFHQHGPLLYSGPSYGKGFVVESSRLAYVDEEGQFFSAQSLRNLVDLILEGQQWMVWKNEFDYSATGRAIAMSNGADASFLPIVVQRLLKIKDVPRKDELLALYEALTRYGGPTVVGNRYYWKSDYMVHRREHYYASVRTTSKHAVATEIVSWMNQKGHFLGDGCMFLYRSGTEYKNIFPLWDWLKIPGATIEQKPLPPVEIQHDAIQGAGETVGAVSDGQYGLSALYLKRDLLEARKSWYFFDNEIVALGSGISCPTDKPVVTTINQSFLRGGVHLAKSQGVAALPDEMTASGEFLWVHHDDTGYVILDAKKVSVSNETRTGRWQELDQNGPTQLLSNQVFTLWLEHGISPQQDTYGYVVLPGISYEEMQDYRLDDHLVILSNTEELQAVWHKGLHMFQGTFWQAGKVQLPNDVTVRTDRPCTLLVRFDGEQVSMAVASLGDFSGVVSVEISMPLEEAEVRWDEEKQVSIVPFQLPSGEYTGQSVVRKLAVQ